MNNLYTREKVDMQLIINMKKITKKSKEKIIGWLILIAMYGIPFALVQCFHYK